MGVGPGAKAQQLLVFAPADGHGAAPRAIARARSCTKFSPMGAGKAGALVHDSWGLMNNLDLYRSQPRDTKIRIHGREAFEGMRRAGELASRALDMLVEHVKPGVTTERLDAPGVEFAHSPDASPAPLNHRGFPT